MREISASQILVVLWFRILGVMKGFYFLRFYGSLMQLKSAGLYEFCTLWVGPCLWTLNFAAYLFASGIKATLVCSSSSDFIPAPSP